VNSLGYNIGGPGVLANKNERSLSKEATGLRGEVVSKRKKKEQKVMKSHIARAENFKKAGFGSTKPKPKSKAVGKATPVASPVAPSAQLVNLNEFLANIGQSDVEKMLTDEGLDLISLKDCTSDDLKEIGLKMGQRKTILREVAKLK